MTGLRAATTGVLGLRIAYGIALIAAPEQVARRWLGKPAGRPATQVPLRALGAREVVIHAGALRSALAGGAVRPWLAGSIFGDLVDLGATILARRDLPEGAPAATLAVGGGSALISALLAVAGDR